MNTVHQGDKAKGWGKRKTKVECTQNSDCIPKMSWIEMVDRQKKVMPKVFYYTHSKNKNIRADANHASNQGKRGIIFSLVSPYLNKCTEKR